LDGGQLVISSGRGLRGTAIPSTNGRRRAAHRIKTGFGLNHDIADLIFIMRHHLHPFGI